MYMYVKYKDGK